jgi:hypothetical protein
VRKYESTCEKYDFYYGNFLLKEAIKSYKVCGDNPQNWRISSSFSRRTLLYVASHFIRRVPWINDLSKELHNLYSSPSIIRTIKSRRMRWAGHVARMEEEERNVYNILVGTPERKRPLGRTRHRWVDNIKMDLREIGWDHMDWTDMVQDRNQWRALVNMVLNLRVPLNAEKFLSGCTIGGFPRSAQLRE